MRNHLFLLGLLAPLSLVGCKNDMTGIWLFEIPYEEDANPCTTTIQENFTAGYVPQGTTVVSDWVHTEDHVGSDAIAFGQIETYGNDSAILVIGTTTFPGIKDGDGWIFEWEDSETTTMQDEHYTDGEVDYGYAERAGTTSTTTYTFTPTDKRSAEVTVESSSTATQTYFESDTWSEDLSFEIGTSGQIPSAIYLVFDDEDISEDPIPQENIWEDDDCTPTADSTACQITIRQECNEEGEFIAYKTDYEEEDYYEHMQGAGQ